MHIIPVIYCKTIVTLHKVGFQTLAITLGRITGGFNFWALPYLDEEWELDPECLVGNDVTARSLKVKLHKQSSDDEISNQRNNDPA